MMWIFTLDELVHALRNAKMPIQCEIETDGAKCTSARVRLIVEFNNKLLDASTQVALKEFIEDQGKQDREGAMGIDNVRNSIALLLAEWPAGSDLERTTAGVRRDVTAIKALQFSGRRTLLSHLPKDMILRQIGNYLNDATEVFEFPGRVYAMERRLMAAELGIDPGSKWNHHGETLLRMTDMVLKARRKG